jgi:hypothetical protein
VVMALPPVSPVQGLNVVMALPPVSPVQGLNVSGGGALLFMGFASIADQAHQFLCVKHEVVERLEQVHVEGAHYLFHVIHEDNKQCLKT